MDEHASDIVGQLRTYAIKTFLVDPAGYGAKGSLDAVGRGLLVDAQPSPAPVERRRGRRGRGAVQDTGKAMVDNSAFSLWRESSRVCCTTTGTSLRRTLA